MTFNPWGMLQMLGLTLILVSILIAVVKRQPDGPTNRHKNDPLVRVGYLLQETA